MGRPAKPDGERVRDIAPTGVRLPQALRDELMRQATINGRSLSQEITYRLQTTISPESARDIDVVVSMGPGAPFGLAEVKPFHGSLTEAHRQLNAMFDALTPDKQLALLTLLRR